MKTICTTILLTLFSAAIALAYPPVTTDPALESANGQKAAHNTAVKTLRASDAWTAMTNQLAQYDTHFAAATNQQAHYAADYITATNKAALIADAATKLAVTKAIAAFDDTETAGEKALKATDDVHDAVVKLIKCFVDYVKACEATN